MLQGKYAVGPNELVIGFNISKTMTQARFEENKTDMKGEITNKLLENIFYDQNDKSYVSTIKKVNHLFLLSISILLISVILASSLHQVTFGQQRVNVAAVGDWGCNSDTRNTVNNINAKKPTLVLGLGDYSYQPTAKCWLNAIKPIEKKVKINIGNHESSPKYGLNQYMESFGLSKQYYSFDHGNIHILTMATELSSKKGSDQFKFVENDLKKASSNTKIKWIVVNLHKPLYTSPNSCSSSSCTSSTSLINAYHPLFDKYRVDLVLQGHIHNYQRTYPIQYNSKKPTSPIVTTKSTSNYNNPKGEIFVIIGTGGINFHGLKSKASFVSKQDAIRFGALDFTVTNSGKKLDAKFYGNDGSIRDSFTIQK